jgi:hypothetical protein
MEDYLTDLHRSTLYWSVAMFLSYRSSTVYSFVAAIRSCHGEMDPHCIFGGHLLSQYHYGSIVYWSVDHALSHLYSEHRYACLRNETYINIV